MQLWPPHKKPSECEGCPRAITGQGFVPGFGSPGGILWLGEQPGDNEVRQGKPFVGKSGDEKKAAGADIGYTTNVRKCLGGKESPAIRQQSIEHCVNAYLQKELSEVKPHRVVCIGADALSVIASRRDIMRCHGSVWDAKEL